MNTNFRNFHRLNCIHEKKKLGKKMVEVEIDAVIMLAVSMRLSIRDSSLQSVYPPDGNCVEQNQPATIQNANETTRDTPS